MGTSPFHGIFSFGQEDHVAAVQQPQKNDQEEHDVLLPEYDTTSHDDATGKIAVDIFEQDDYYIIRAPIAGVKLSDLDIEVDGNDITVRGSRRVTDDVQENQFYLQECYWGDFCRKVTMPCSIDPKKIKATFSKDSILKILIPKEEKVKIVRINEGG